jgi:L-aminopeptidase/D-esterase-like protein
MVVGKNYNKIRFFLGLALAGANRNANRERNKMILANGNMFITDVALENGLAAVEIVKEKLACTVLGVEFEMEGNTPICTRPIVSVLMHDIEGVHTYQVNLSEKTLKVYK